MYGLDPKRSRDGRHQAHELVTPEASSRGPSVVLGQGRA